MYDSEIRNVSLAEDNPSIYVPIEKISRIKSNLPGSHLQRHFAQGTAEIMRSERTTDCERYLF